ncbi:MAG: AI-2E family transporter [Planctomycetota bacterium]
MNGRRSFLRDSRALLLVVVLLVVATLWLARAILIPFALALLLSFLFAPVVERVQRLGLGRVPAVVVVTVLSFAVIFALGGLLTYQLADLVAKLPDYRENIAEKVRTLRDSILSVDRATETVQTITKAVEEPNAALAPATAPHAALQPDAPEPAAVHDGQSEHLPPWLAIGRSFREERPPPVDVRVVGYERGWLEFLREIVGPVLSPFATAGIVIVFVIFMLIQREDLRDRLIRLVGHGRITLTTEALTEASTRVSRYLLALFLLNGAHGLVIGTGLWLIGLPNAPLWGLLAAILRFIPYVGPWLAAALPITLALAVFQGWTRPLLVLALHVGVEVISNNVFEPWLYGSRIGASPMAIIISAVFWTWLWGPVGLVLATPLTVCLVVVGKYVPQLEFLEVLLGDQPVLRPDVHFYQRLVAMDEVEAAEVIDVAVEKRSLVELYDQFVVPALAHMERDRHAGILSAARAAWIRQSVRELLDEMRERFGLPHAAAPAPANANAAEPAKPPAAAPRQPLTALCVPARDEADELVARMLGQVLELDGHRARVLTADVLASELLEIVRQERPPVLCVSALPPATTAQTRYLCKRLHGAFPELNIVVGLWTSRLDAVKAAERVGCGPALRVVTTLEAARQAVSPPRPAAVPRMERAAVPRR